MRQSESITSLAAALVKAQAEMGGAVKDSSNPFFKSKYADLTSVVRAIKEPFAKHGLAYTQFPIRDDNGVGVVTRLIHESGEWLEGEYILPMVKLDPQAAGSAITYARRYALQAMAGIPTADDDAESAMIRGEVAPDPMQLHLEAVANNLTAITYIKEALSREEYETAYEAFQEISEADRSALWMAPTKGGKAWTTKEIAQFKSNEWGAARKVFNGIATEGEAA
jgi:hypothetical protein